LEAEGFRFALQNGVFAWAHPALLGPSAIDCTDMPDDQFEALVRSVEAAKVLATAHDKAAPRRFTGEPVTGFGSLA